MRAALAEHRRIAARIGSAADLGGPARFLSFHTLIAKIAGNRELLHLLNRRSGGTQAVTGAASTARRPCAADTGSACGSSGPRCARIPRGLLMCRHIRYAPPARDGPRGRQRPEVRRPSRTIKRQESDADDIALGALGVPGHDGPPRRRRGAGQLSGGLRQGRDAAQGEGLITATFRRFVHSAGDRRLQGQVPGHQGRNPRHGRRALGRYYAERPPARAPPTSHSHRHDRPLARIRRCGEVADAHKSPEPRCDWNKPFPGLYTVSTNR